MCVKHTFGILKERYRIFMRFDIPLWYVTHIVAICIVLHNMYTICKDKFDMKWIEKNRKRIEKANR